VRENNILLPSLAIDTKQQTEDKEQYKNQPAKQELIITVKEMEA
jgi:hypothetical protein